MSIAYLEQIISFTHLFNNRGHFFQCPNIFARKIVFNMVSIFMCNGEIPASSATSAVFLIAASRYEMKL